LREKSFASLASLKKIPTFAGQLKNEVPMLIIPVKEGENIERALKRFKKKFERTGTMRQLRSRQHFTKKSVEDRKEMLKARYINKIRLDNE